MNKQTKIVLVVAGLVTVVALALAAWLFIKNNDLEDKNRTLETEKQSQEKTPKSESTETKADSTKPTTQSASKLMLSESQKENIKAALDTMNTQPLESYMDSRVEVIVAASGGQPPMSSRDATMSLDYFSSAAAPWEFSEGPSYESSEYKQYFSDSTYVGKSVSGQVVSFHFNDAGKIDRIFMAIDESLL